MLVNHKAPAPWVEPGQPTLVRSRPNLAATVLVKRKDGRTSRPGRRKAVADEDTRPLLEAIKPTPFSAQPEAALCVLQDLRKKKPAWWSHKPLEWLGLVTKRKGIETKPRITI